MSSSDSERSNDSLSNVHNSAISAPASRTLGRFCPEQDAESVDRPLFYDKDVIFFMLYK
jgi:hypothetical protein